MAARTAKGAQGAKLAGGGKPLCCITIGCDEYLLPAEAGMKVAQLMAGAVKLRKHYRTTRSGYVYAPGAQAEVAWCSVQPGQLVTADQADAFEAEEEESLRAYRARRLTADQPKLPAPEAP